MWVHLDEVRVAMAPAPALALTDLRLDKGGAEPGGSPSCPWCLPRSPAPTARPSSSRDPLPAVCRGPVWPDRRHDNVSIISMRAGWYRAGVAWWRPLAIKMLPVSKINILEQIQCADPPFSYIAGVPNMDPNPKLKTAHRNVSIQT